MLRKKYRLSRKQIGFIHKKGRRLNVEGISIKCLANRLGYSRFAVNVPVSVSKKATERNRIRRIIYDEIGKIKPSGSIDCLINIYHKADPPARFAESRRAGEAGEKLLREKIKKICANL